MNAALALAVLGIGGQDAAPSSLQLICRDAGSSRLEDATDVRRRFAARAVNIVRAAARNDRQSLSLSVSRAAEFTIWRGDAGIGRRLTGSDGAIEFARYIDSTQFGYHVPFAGPVSTNRCGAQTVTITFSSMNGERAFTVDFRFDGGLLVEAVGHEGTMTEGELFSDRDAHG